MKETILHRFLIIILLSAVMPFYTYGNDIVTVEGVATYYGESNDSPSDCKRKALAQARIEALRKFGTIVSQNVFQTESESESGSESKFLSLSESEVKGEWLGDIGEPEYETSFSGDDTLVVKCRIKGRARALSNRSAEFEAMVLRNGTDKRNADTQFKSGDDMYLYFAAPIDGYVMAFLLDESGEAYCLLPYLRATDDLVKVRKNYDYIFFDPKRGGTESATVDEMVMTAEKKREYNKLYVLFSPEPISKPLVRPKSDGVPASMSAEEFQKWIVRIRRNDERLGVKSIPLTIDSTGGKTETIRK